MIRYGDDRNAVVTVVTMLTDDGDNGDVGNGDDMVKMEVVVSDNDGGGE